MPISLSIAWIYLKTRDENDVDDGCSDGPMPVIVMSLNHRIPFLQTLIHYIFVFAVFFIHFYLVDTLNRNKFLCVRAIAAADAPNVCNYVKLLQSILKLKLSQSSFSVLSN